jgi:acyl-CoA dehydrogenase
LDFSLSPKQQHWLDRVRNFIDKEIVPVAATMRASASATAGDRWQVSPRLEGLKAKAREQGLWNLFLPPAPEHDTEQYHGAGLTNLEYALCAEEMGRVFLAAEVFNCSAPDTGNMEVLHRYGTAEQKSQWLAPLMAGEIRSAFLMTEPDVASSDATNITTSIVRDGEEYVLNGRKWWSSGAGDPRCKMAIVMGKTDPSAPTYAQQSMILVPMSAPGLEVVRLLTVFGYDDAPHGHADIVLKDVRVPAGNLLLGEGRGFEIAQGRLGPGRIHHCMRTIGAAEVALTKMSQRLLTRVAFGKTLAEQSVWEQRVAEARIAIEQTRLLCLKAADMMDKVGNKGAQREIAMIKVAAPRMALKIIDDAIQAHGGAGVSDDFGLAESYAQIRTLRLADGPDEVHNRSIAKLEFRRHAVKEKNVSSETGGAFSGVKAVEERHQFNQAALAEWMLKHVAGFSGPLTVLQFKGGQSNPTYKLETPGRTYVLRRKPFGALLPSAHAVDREFRLMTALGATEFPVPKAYALCEDATVIGAMFYVMEAIEGPIHWNGALPGLNPAQRTAMYTAMVETLAKLHTLDHEKLGLSDYGKPGNYFARQVERWTKQYRASEGAKMEAAERLMEWLPRTVPEQQRVSIVHGDYRLDNLIFSPDNSRIAAVVDWELSTIGDPLADFTYMLMQWVLPADGSTGLAGLDQRELGIPLRKEMAALYCKLTGRESLPDLNWYFAYNLFRLLGIVQGIAGRVREGTAASAKAAEMAALGPMIAEAAWGFAVRAGA